MVDWKEKIFEIAGDVAHIKVKVDKFDKGLQDHEGRIRTLEHDHDIAEGEEIAEERFYQRHPIKTGLGVGGIGGGTLIAVGAGILRLFGVI